MITEAINFPITAYGTSKAAVNYIVKKIDLEYSDVIAFPMQ
jgi:norsolorinic acid ketoreductase